MREIRVLPYGRGAGSAMMLGWPVNGRRFAMQGRVSRLTGGGIILHFRIERRVHALLNRPQRRESWWLAAPRPRRDPRVHREFRDTAPRRRGEICRSTASDRRPRTVCPASALIFRQSDWAGSSAASKQQDFGLQWIGVLKFVDEDVREAILQIAADFGLSRTRSRARSSRSTKSNLPGASLESVVLVHQIPHFRAKRRRPDRRRRRAGRLPAARADAARAATTCSRGTPSAKKPLPFCGFFLISRISLISRLSSES